jgi:diaminopimelate epimerase
MVRSISAFAPAGNRIPLPGRKKIGRLIVLSSKALAFVKMQATGNDFVVLDALDGKRRNWPALSRRLCDRHFGIGSDGLLVVLPATIPQAACRMRMFNPDGTEDMCGNGLRCVAAYFFSAGHTKAAAFNIQTLSGQRAAHLTIKNGKVISVQVDLGRSRLRGREIPVAADLEKVVDYPLPVAGRIIPVTVVSTGTPHAVVFSSNPEEILELGPQIMSHPFFPEQTSVSWVKVEAPTCLRARTWERGGVGESLSCGTGAAAILTAAHLKGISPRQGEIIYPGGHLQVRWDCEETLWLAGPAEIVFSGVINI